MPGAFRVPSNPIAPVTYTPTIGELLPAKFVLPENPIVRELSGFSSLRPNSPRNVALSGLAGGCGCIAGMCGQGCEGLGMGALDLSSMGSLLPILLLGGLAVMMLTGGGTKTRSDYYAARLRAKADYATRVASLQRRHRPYRRTKVARPKAVAAPALALAPAS